jgi:hypothetical protein
LSSVHPEFTHSGDSRWRPRTNAVMCKHAGGCRRSQVLETRSWPCTASASQAHTYQRPERKARAQGLNHAWRELLELVSLHTVLLGRGGVLT